ncbi:glycoside-pentoside-hexuronide (GPH):cation symporter [Ruminococcaceae bacterium OttesenSCG-928-A11]|nr:glycoside-pentoside-hexuronide (GPH):cation symporter [Ruminococcaceae bacterium OttesenSCG-928-A11]
MDSKTNVLSRGTVLSFGFGEFSRQASAIIQSTFLLFYLVNYAGLKATPVGIMIMVAKIWDAINDPIMGTIVDNTNSKYGKVRPYLLYGSVPAALFLLMLFTIPQGLSPTWKMIWATVAYVGTGMLTTLVDVPYNTLMVRITNSSEQRMRLARSKGIIGTIGVLLPALVIPIFTESVANPARGYAISVGIMAVAIAGAYLTVFKGTRETINTNDTNKLNFFAGLKTLFANKYWVKMVVSYTVYGVTYALSSGVMMFYVTAKYNNAALTTILMGMMMVAMVGASVVSKPLTDRLGKVKTVTLGLIVGIAGMVLRIISGDPSFAIMVIGTFCYGFCASIFTTCLMPMVSETVDYGELKTGIRVESLSFAGLTLASKTGQGVATAVLAVLLDAVGYIEGAGAQSEGVINGLLHIGATGPMVVLAIMLVVMLTYDMDKKYPDYIAQLDRRRAGASGNAK